MVVTYTMYYLSLFTISIVSIGSLSFEILYSNPEKKMLFLYLDMNV